MFLKMRWRSLLWVCLLLVTAGSVTAVTRAATAESQRKPDWKPVTLLYLSDIKGKIEPCG